MNTDSDRSAEFNRKSLSEYLKDFTTDKARERAIDTLHQVSRATKTAQSAFQKVYQKNLPNARTDLNMDRSRSPDFVAKRQRVDKAHKKLTARLDKIERAQGNRVDRIKALQKIEIAARRQMKGRTLSEEFRPRR